jgi:ABC-type enterobactin transport system permease subunit
MTIIRTVALPIVAAGIIAGAALGLAGTATAATTATNTTGSAPSISTTNGNFTAPSTYATPAYNPVAGIHAWRHYHRG